MGIFDKNYEKTTDQLYNDIKKYLNPKDGKRHIRLTNTSSKLMTNNYFGGD